MSIQAVVFDADGVLISPWRFAQLLDEQYGITRQITRSFFCGVFNECLLGKADLKQTLQPFLEEWGWQSSVDDFVSLWLEAENSVDERVIDIVQRLRQSQYICCLATNQERYRAEYMANTMRLSAIFDKLFFSCDIGYAKPDPAYFQSITKAIEMNASDLLLWDDSTEHVEAARLLNWNAEIYTDFSAFREKIVSYFPLLYSDAHRHLENHN